MLYDREKRPNKITIIFIVLFVASMLIFLLTDKRNTGGDVEINIEMIKDKTSASMNEDSGIIVRTTSKFGVDYFEVSVTGGYLMYEDRDGNQIKVEESKYIFFVGENIHWNTNYEVNEDVQMTIDAIHNNKVVSTKTVMMKVNEEKEYQAYITE